MKQWTLIIAIVLTSQLTFAQAGDTAPKRPAGFPTIQLLQIDSTTLTNGQVKKDQPTIIMYFSPTCDHCKHQMRDIIAAMNDLSSVQFILATYQPFEDMVSFYKEFQLEKYPNIRIGRDVSYKIAPFFDIHSLPYLAIYNKKNELVTTFEGNQKAEKLIKALQ